MGFPDLAPEDSGTRRRRLGWLLAGCLLALGLLLGTPAQAGHESPFYPSHYPQEITVETVEPGSVAARFQKNSLHAYVGADPFAGAPIPANVGVAESLGSYLVATLNPAAAALGTPEARCAAARSLASRLAGASEPFVFHPHPVTPYHPDYLQHADLVEDRKRESRNASDAGPAGSRLKVRAGGGLAERLVRARWQPAEGEWDAALEEVDVRALLASRAVSVNGWLGPPWLKEGWFHAYLLLADAVANGARRQAADRIHRRLARGEYGGLAEKLNLERTLLSLLTRGCERSVLGYTLRREYFNTEYSGGVENIAQDSHAGLVAPIFIRTVKLKDFPWNGWLTLGVGAWPAAAWNPVGGFTDSAGRLIWSAVGDPALFPAPFGGHWIPNRVTPTVALGREVTVPPDALIPEPGTGVLRKVGPGKTASAKILYKVRMSAFHDGIPMTVADLLYPFVFSYRWGVREARSGSEYDAVVDRSTALLRERLAGLRVERVEQQTREIAEVKLVWVIPHVEVYLRATSADLHGAVAVAPPWSSLPWHLTALMEEAVRQGAAAFSREEAERRGVAWLDLVRSAEARARLAALAEQFERQGYVPDPLKEFVPVPEARQRWRALKEFSDRHGHFLVTNGPYRLEKWSQDSAVLQAFRDFSYPVGVGAFDRYVLPPRAFISKVERRGPALRISAEIEKAVRVQRSYTLAREALVPKASVGAYPVEPVCGYVVVNADGEVLRAGTAPFGGDGTFTVDLAGLPPGRHVVLTAIYLNGNYVHPDVKAMEYRVER